MLDQKLKADEQLVFIGETIMSTVNGSLHSEQIRNQIIVQIGSLTKFKEPSRNEIKKIFQIG